MTSGVNARPRIGVSPCYFHPDPARNVFKGKTLYYFEASMVQWIERNGAFPVLLPEPKATLTYDDLAAEIDGLVLQGGVDMAPQSYGEEPLRPEWAGDSIRDACELALLRACIEKKKPVFGVCRGFQVINVGFGGSLYQDIQTMHPAGKVHRDREVYDQLFHDVRIEPGSWLEATFGARDGRVNSVHHQGVKVLGRGLIAEAFSNEDGLVEAFRSATDAPFVYGVQWHPEFQDPGRKDLLSPDRLFAKFLSQVSASKRA